MPLCSRKQSKGEGLAPRLNEAWKTFLYSSSLLVTMAPITRSEWPPRYFVQLLYEMSAPSSRGDCRQGEAKVLSHTVIKLCFLANLQTYSMSIILRVGLVGVSIQIILVSALINFSIFSKLVISTKSTLTPNFSCAQTRIQRWVPPQTSSHEIMWSPVLRMCKMVAVAPQPLEQVVQNLPYSRAARHCSTAYRVGFPPRVQSNLPQGWAISCWAQVDVMWMGTLTLPWMGSGSQPSWIAKVAKPSCRHWRQASSGNFSNSTLGALFLQIIVDGLYFMGYDHGYGIFIHDIGKYQAQQPMKVQVEIEIPIRVFQEDSMFLVLAGVNRLILGYFELFLIEVAKFTSLGISGSLKQRLNKR